MKRFLPPLLLPFLLFSFATTGHLSHFHHFKIATLLDFAFLWLLVPWMIVPLLILCVRFKEKNKSDPTLRGNTSRTPTTNNAETIDTAPSQKQQIGVGSTVVSPPQPALPFQNGSTMKTSDEQIDDKPSGKEERKGDDKNWIPRGANQEKLNKSRKSDKQNAPHDLTKLLVSQSGKEKKEKATAWPVRPKWSESVPESQVADDLSDFGLTKRTDPTMNVSGFVDDKKKEDKKDEMKEDPTKSSVFLDDVKKEKEEKKEEGKDEKKEEKREEKKEEEGEVKKDEKEEKKEEKKE